MGRPKKRQRTDGDLIDGPAGNKRAEGSLWDTDLAIQTSDVIFGGGPFETAFTPGGSLQPWLQTNIDWPKASEAVHGPKSNYNESMPGLTPEFSNNSPPGLNLPLELQHNHHDNSTTLLLDPALTGPETQRRNSSDPPVGCACLSTMYLTLNNLQAVSTDLTFPFSLHPLREAMQSASQVLDCQHCPTRFITAIQNTQLLGTLLISIAERFGKILQHITNEAIRADLAGETKKFRLADLNTPTSHLHAGGLGCLAAFSVNLSPDEWKNMCKKVVKAEVHGPGEGNDCCPYFLGIVKKMEDRQDGWHKNPVPGDYPRDGNGAPIEPKWRFDDRLHEDENGQVTSRRCGDSKRKEEPMCLKMVSFAKRVVESLDWS